MRSSAFLSLGKHLIPDRLFWQVLGSSNMSKLVSTLACFPCLFILMSLIKPDAALQVVLARYCRQDDVVVGTPTNGRHMPELQQMVGNLVNMLPIRTQFPADAAFKDVLAAVRDAYLGALEHEDLPFNKLVELLGIQRAPNRTPLFQAIVAVNEQSSATEGPASGFTPVPSEVRHGGHRSSGNSIIPSDFWVILKVRKQPARSSTQAIVAVVEQYLVMKRASL